MKLREVEFELYVETLFDANFHLDRPIGIRLNTNIRHQELFFLCYAIVIPVDHNIYVVPESDNDAVVAFKLLFNPVELEIILHVVSQSARWFKVTHDL